MGIKRIKNTDSVEYNNKIRKCSRKSDNTNITLIDNDIIININGNYFKFIDVPGDGDCFYHSILQSKI